jgi:3-phosphoshikimate 1-carboxyvinyltransferase
MTARALVLSAGAVDGGTVHRPLRARDTILMAAGLRAMGSEISTRLDDAWTVEARPLRGPATVDVGLAGTVMRFLPALAAVARGPVHFDGDPRARLRPLAPLIEALATLGVMVEPSGAAGLPLTIHGTGRVTGGEVTMDASTSSQLVSGLLLSGAHFERGVRIRNVGPPVPSAPHLRMTVQMLRAAGAQVDDSGGDVWSVAPGKLTNQNWEIEPDLSSAAPFLAAALVTGGEVVVPRWPAVTSQPGDRLRELLTAMGGAVSLSEAGLTVRGTGTVRGIDVDLGEVGELTPVLAALAALADSPSRLRGIGHIRSHETDRLAALARELCGVGARVTELADGLSIEPAPLRGCRFETYDDHRMAHAAAVLGLVVADLRLSDVACTTKTMPTFPEVWSTMAGGEPATTLTGGSG